MEDYFTYIVQRLSSLYGMGEARAIAFVLLEDGFGLSRTDIYANRYSISRSKVTSFSQDAHLRLLNMCKRLEKGEPVQQVVGFARFAGHRFEVSREVLIPRPETEELLQWAIDLQPSNAILDIGTGSGCLAISIALAFLQAHVVACDISPAALAIARRNASALQASVHFIEMDILKSFPQPFPLEKKSSAYSLIISNPPYICEKEQETMEKNVLNYEPHQALFVPDDNPLLFYKAIARHATQGALTKGGSLLVETHCDYAQQVAALFSSYGLEQVEIRCDQFGRERFVGAKR